jgi:hypothetical protein
MTGRELAKAVRTAKGKVAVPVGLGDVFEYVYAEKADLIATLERLGNMETGKVLETESGGYFLKDLD